MWLFTTGAWGARDQVTQQMDLNEEKLRSKRISSVMFQMKSNFFIYLR